MNPQYCTVLNMSITDDSNESKINPSCLMPPALIKATYNDYFSISHFHDSLTSQSKEIQYRATCSSFTPCYFAIVHIEYHIKMSPLAPHAFFGMLPIFIYHDLWFEKSKILCIPIIWYMIIMYALRKLYR